MKNNIKAIREDKQLTQENVSVKAGITLRHYQKIEAGVTIPGVKIARDISKVLNVPIEELWDFGNAA